MHTDHLIGLSDSPDRTKRLAHSIEGVLAEPVTVRSWRGGVDCWVDQVRRQDGSVQVVRSPRVEVLETSYDGTVDFGDVLERESAVLSTVARTEVPAPRVVATHRRDSADDTTWMIQDLLPGAHPDAWSSALSRDLGRITQVLHAVRPTLPVLAPPTDWAAWVRTRIAARLEAVRRYTDLPPTSAVLGPASAALERRGVEAGSVLHLDLRPDNLLVDSGAITGVLDFANTVVGDPMFELARIRRYGFLDDDFLLGYGPLPAARDTELLLDTYELDTAALLTVVGVEEISNRELHEANLERTKQLCSRLADRHG